MADKKIKKNLTRKKAGIRTLNKEINPVKGEQNKMFPSSSLSKVAAKAAKSAVQKSAVQNLLPALNREEIKPLLPETTAGGTGK